MANPTLSPDHTKPVVVRVGLVSNLTFQLGARIHLRD